MTPPSPSAARPSPWIVVPALAVLLGLQPVTTDLYLPALPALRADLQGSMAATQLTLSALLLSFGVSQLFLGPLSDRFGRRPVLIAGLLIYALATLASAAAPGMGVLIACRIVQGLGMAASVVCARAMVRDLFEPQDGARVMARALSGLGLIALSGPVAGALLVSQWGWRATFLSCAVYVSLALAGVVWRLPETLARPNRDATRLMPLVRAWGRIGTHPAFVVWSLLIAFTYGCIYTFLAGSAFVYIEVLGASRMACGLAISGVTLVYIAGTLACHRALPRLGMQRAVRRGALFTLAGAVALLGMGLSGWATAWAVTLASMSISFGHGHHQPCAQAAVVGPFPALAGTASALAGCLMSALAFGIGGWLGATMDGTAAPVLLTQGFFAALTATVAATVVQRHGDVGRPSAAAGGAPATPR